MAARNSTQRIKEYVPGIIEVRNKSRWLVSSGAPKQPEDLDFVARDSNGRMIWWEVTPPNTDYWHAHEILGRAHAFNLLDMINNPEAEYPPHILAYVTNAIQQWSVLVSPCAAEGMTHGFFGVLSEYIATGTANR